MINNFNLLRKFIEFRSEDDFYFIQVIQRKKDFKDDQRIYGTNNNSRLVKAYYVGSLEYYDFVQQEIIKLCEVFNARAGINLNRRSYKKSAFNHLKKITDQLMDEHYTKTYKAYSSVVGSFMNETDKKWILDIDTFDLPNLSLMDNLYNCDPIGDKILEEIPSKAGSHLISKPFNIKQFREHKEYDDVEIHKNNPTNLYIP